MQKKKAIISPERLEEGRCSKWQDRKIPKTARAPGVMVVTSGGTRAPRFNKLVSTAAARILLRCYDRSVAATRVGRHEGETGRVARLLNVIPAPRRNSVMRTRFIGEAVTEQPCKKVVGRLADIAADGQDPSATKLERDVHAPPGVHKEGSAADRVESVTRRLRQSTLQRAANSISSSKMGNGNSDQSRSCQSHYRGH